MPDSAAITQAGGRPVALNWGSSVLAADLHSGNRREVARAEFMDPREITITFAPSGILADEFLYAQTEAELHIGSGAISYVVPVPMSLRGCVMHITCKTISVRLFSNQTAGAQQTLPRQARWMVGIALGQSIKQPPRLDNINTIGTVTPVMQLLKPWTTAVQLIPVKNGVIAAPDMSKIFVEEVHWVGPPTSVNVYGSFQYAYEGTRAMDTPMPLHHWTNCLRITNTNAATVFLHIIEHWQL